MRCIGKMLKRKLVEFTQSPENTLALHEWALDNFNNDKFLLSKYSFRKIKPNK